MAGLVDYVVDSEEENNSEKTQDDMDMSESKPRGAISRYASNSPSSSRKQDVDAKSGSDVKEDLRETRDASSKRSRDKDKSERKKSREKDADRRKRSRSRSKDRNRDRKHRDERRRRKSHSRSRSRSPRRGHRDGDRNRDRRDWKSDLRKKYEADAKPSNSAGTQSSVPALPAYYNPAAVNPAKVADQLQKRKLLWGNKEKKETPPTTKVWDAATFSQDQDGKVTAKFKRLMGIKEDSGSGGDSSTASDVTKKQEELFATLDQQYEIARATTHTQRGVGLGFSSGLGFPR